MSDRTIKFRVWNLNLKNWIENCVVLGAKGDICSYSYHIKDNGEGIHNVGILNKEDNIVQQFTGLTDKNDKEIYEGDYVRFKDNQYLVEYSNGSFWVGGQTTLGKAMLEGGVLVTCNIFDNPDSQK